MVAHEDSDLPRHLKDETEADKFRSAGIDEPESVSGFTNTDPGTETDADRLRSAGLDEAAGLAVNADPGTDTEADRFRSDRLDEPGSVSGEGFTNTDEGVETDAQFNYLSQFGCTLIQGFLLSRPKTIAELLAFHQPITCD